MSRPASQPINWFIGLLFIVVWVAPVYLTLRNVIFVDAEGVPSYLKATNIAKCPHCRGRYISTDGGRVFSCLDCSLKGEKPTSEKLSSLFQESSEAQ